MSKINIKFCDPFKKESYPIQKTTCQGNPMPTGMAPLEMPGADLPPEDCPSLDMTMYDMPAADLPMADLPMGEMLLPDLSMDMPLTEMPMCQPMAELPMTEMPMCQPMNQVPMCQPKVAMPSCQKPAPVQMPIQQQCPTTGYTPAPQMVSPTCPNLELAKAYIEIQQYKTILPPERALMLGTLFPELYKPYVPKPKMGGIW